jgi:RNA polymerase sigma-B factor
MAPRLHARAVAPSDWPACDLRTLLSRCSAGDTRARETIIVRFLPLASSLARLYEGRGEPIEDLCQAASVGLIKAVDRYSPDRGDSFAAYARPMIMGELRHHFRDTTWRLHVPRPIKDRAAQVLRAEQELSAVSGAVIEPSAVADHLGLGSDEVGEARHAMAANWPRSLDAPNKAADGDGDGDAIALREAIGDDESGYERVEVSVGIGRAVRKLGPRDGKVLLLRLAFELTQDEIAARIGVSQMHVSRILRNAGAALTTSCGLAVGV